MRPDRRPSLSRGLVWILMVGGSLRISITSAAVERGRSAFSALAPAAFRERLVAPERCTRLVSRGGVGAYQLHETHETQRH